MKTLLLFCLPLLLASCSTFKPVRDTSFRLLLDAKVPSRPLTSSRPAVAISRPTLPPYLDRQQIITRTTEGQLLVHESHLWSEPLNSGMARVIADNLRRLTGSTTIQPVGDFVTLDYTSLVEIQVAQFDPDASGVLVFQCTWKIQPVAGGHSSFKSFHTEVPIESTTSVLNGRVPAMNEAIARLSRVIAKSL